MRARMRVLLPLVIILVAWCVQSTSSFTTEQASAGRTAYEQNCATCHGANLRQLPDALLAGREFAAKWGSRRTDELVAQMRSTMPPGNPGGLPEGPIRLFHCHLPRSRMLLRDRLAEWVVELTTRFKGTQDFVRALTVFSSEASALGYAADFVRVDWFPSGSYLLEQGEPATTMHFLLSGQVEIRREDDSGRVAVVDRSGSGEFIGEEGIATGQPRNAHVVAVDDVTCLTFLASTDSFDGRGNQAQPRLTRSLPSGDQIDPRVSTCIDVSAFVGHKIRATAAHRSQYPIDPEMFPERILREMFGAEYFIQVLPERSLDASLLDG